MYISTLHVNNFKSLVGFHIDLTKFNCLIGLNGSRKSTVLQFLDFLGQLARGTLDSWLKERIWKASELKSYLAVNPLDLNNNNGVERSFYPDRNPGRYITFALNLQHQLSGKIVIHCKACFDTESRKCITESFKEKYTTTVISNKKMIKKNRQTSQEDILELQFEYQGSILSQLREDYMTTGMRKIKKFFSNLNAYDMLAPHFLRQRTRRAGGNLGLGGQNLAA